METQQPDHTPSMKEISNLAWTRFKIVHDDLPQKKKTSCGIQSRPMLDIFISGASLLLIALSVLIIIGGILGVMGGLLMREKCAHDAGYHKLQHKVCSLCRIAGKMDANFTRMGHLVKYYKEKLDEGNCTYLIDKDANKSTYYDIGKNLPDRYVSYYNKRYNTVSKIIEETATLKRMTENLDKELAIFEKDISNITDYCSSYSCNYSPERSYDDFGMCIKKKLLLLDYLMIPALLGFIELITALIGRRAVKQKQDSTNYYMMRMSYLVMNLFSIPLTLGTMAVTIVQIIYTNRNYDESLRRIVAQINCAFASAFLLMNILISVSCCFCNSGHPSSQEMFDHVTMASNCMSKNTDKSEKTDTKMLLTEDDDATDDGSILHV